MKIRDSSVMLCNIFPYGNRMLMPAVERPVHELDLRHLLIDEELKLPLHRLQIPEPQLPVHRRQTVATGKRTSPAALIIDDLIPEFLHIVIHKGNAAKIRHRAPGVVADSSAGILKCNSFKHPKPCP